MSIGHFGAFSKSSSHGTSLIFPGTTPNWNPDHDYSYMIYDELVARHDPRGMASRPAGVSSTSGQPGATLPWIETGGPSSTTQDTTQDPLVSTRAVHRSGGRGVPIAPRPEPMAETTVPDARDTMTGCIGRVRRRKFGHNDLEKVNKVRKKGACLRCRVYKLSVRGLY